MTNETSNTVMVGARAFAECGAVGGITLLREVDEPFQTLVLVRDFEGEERVYVRQGNTLREWIE